MLRRDGHQHRILHSITGPSNLVCRPLQHFWDPLVEGHCGNGRIADVISAVFNSAADIIILILPQTIIWKLHMAPEKKFGIAAIFAIGLV